MHTPLLSVFKLLLKWAGFAASFMPHFRCSLRIQIQKQNVSIELDELNDERHSDLTHVQK